MCTTGFSQCCELWPPRTVLERDDVIWFPYSGTDLRGGGAAAPPPPPFARIFWADISGSFRWHLASSEPKLPKKIGAQKILFHVFIPRFVECAWPPRTPINAYLFRNNFGARAWHGAISTFELVAFIDHHIELRMRPTVRSLIRGTPRILIWG